MTDFKVGDTVRLADKMRERGDTQRIMRANETNVVAYVEPGFIGFSWDGEPVWGVKRFELVKSVVNTNEFLEIGEFATEPDSVVVPVDIANPFPAKVRAILSEIGDTIIAKNAQYGNSALEPVRIFSKASATEQIKVRMDDKISRLVRGNGEGDEDATFDLLGYIVLLKIAESEDD